MPTPDASNQMNILILGDSTIDNKMWVGTEQYALHFGQNAIQTKALNLVNAINPLRPKSVVEHCRNEFPSTAKIVDRTNDGFTTSDILKGNMKDKVFGSDQRLYPNEFFEPLKSDAIENATHVILSIGGNNFREFIVRAMQTHTSQRADFIQGEFPGVLAKAQNEYNDILIQISKRNPNVKFILMTQYYPALKQKTLLGIDIYDFMEALGKLSNTSKLDASVQLMEQMYADVIRAIHTDPQLKQHHYDIVDITSSLNPHISENYVGQIEPSSQGGKRISQMLSHVIRQSQTTGNHIFRFSPGFFSSNSDINQFVHKHPLSAGSVLTPVHPNQIPTKEGQHGRTPQEVHQAYAFKKSSEVPVPENEAVSQPVTQRNNATAIAGGAAVVAFAAYLVGFQLLGIVVLSLLGGYVGKKLNIHQGKDTTPKRTPSNTENTVASNATPPPKEPVATKGWYPTRQSFVKMQKEATLPSTKTPSKPSAPTP